MTLYRSSLALFGTALPLVLLTGCPPPADADGDGWSELDDCDDNDPAVHPEAEEVCGNGLDDDCAPSPQCSLEGEHSIGDVGTLLPASGEGLRSGSSMVSLGDLDGDGYADFAVGEPGQSQGAEGAGGVVLWFGSPEGPERPVRLHGTVSGAAAGSSLAAPGDVTGDGVADLLVGAPGEGPADDTGEEASLLPRGAVYLLAGPFENDGAMTPVSVLRGAAPGDCAGTSLAALGDISGDGLGDFVVGAPCRGSFRQVHEHLGQLMLFDGPGLAHLVTSVPAGDSDLSSAHASFPGEEIWDSLGTAITALPDQDGDGQMDFAIASPDYFGAEWINPDAQAHVHIFSSSSVGETPTTAALATLAGGCCGFGRHDAAGTSLASDSQRLLIGAPTLSDFEIEGGAFILSGPLSGDIDAFEEGGVLAAPTQANESALAGTSVAAGLDLNCDGVPDYVVGAPLARDEGPRTGAVLIAFGPSDSYVALGDSGGRLIGERSGDEAGRSLLAVGDVDGDGCDDLVIGSPARYTEGTDGGGAWFVKGARE